MEALQTTQMTQNDEKGERYLLYAKIADRAISEGFCKQEGLLQLLIDIESADVVFDMRLEDWLEADRNAFGRDIAGICVYSDRSSGFPASFGGFVPWFAKTEEVAPMEREDLLKSVADAVENLLVEYRLNSGISFVEVSPEDAKRLEQTEGALTDLIISVCETSRNR